MPNDIVIIKRAKNIDTWLEEKGVYRGAVRDDRKTANVSCPECGRAGSLSNHSIAEDGVVTPSLVCGYDDCDFHRWIKLEDWKP